MAANFPDSPSLNATFTENGLTFVWNGSAWKLNSSSGTKGEKGQKGEVGVTGSKGQKGEKGEVGAKGQKGEIGATGGTGGTGNKGQKGEIGAAGSDGSDGDKGQKGEVGATGSGGAGGDKGQKGEEGPQGGGAPVGQIVAWSGSAGSLPTGYFLCDGSAISRTTYAALFTIVGTTHGAGNGSSTFNIPDLRDRFILGASNSTGDTSYPGVSPGATGGSANATLVSHDHTFSGSSSHSHTVNNHTHSFSGTGSNTHNHNIFSTDIDDHNDSARRIENSRNDWTGYYPSNRDISTDSTTVSISVSGTTGGSSPGTNSQTVSISGTTNAQGSSATNANLPPYYALAYIIQYAQGGSTAKGQKGETGSTGSTGSTGAKGQKGEAGDKGAASSVQGPAGDKGQKGEIGATGAGGSSGSAGAKGQKGEKGEVGASGDKGEIGSTGSAGSAGSDGSDGAKGQKGELGADGIPSGFIGLWSGAADAIPSGWYLCNGSNGTPDLRGRFVVGYSNTDSDYDVGDTGGAKTDTVNISVSGTTSTDSPAANGSSYNGATIGNLNRHTHTFSGSSSDTVNTRPPYYALAYIMKA